jgi:cytochrome c-type biogenesis protein CcmH/NrfG
MSLSRRLHRQRPDDFWNNYTLASLLASNAPPRWEDATRYYTAALALHPENAATQHELARLLVHRPRPGKDHVEEAIDLAKKAVKAAPTVGRYWGTLGTAHYRAGQWRDALVAFQQADKLRDDSKSLDWLYLAMIYVQLGEKEEGRNWVSVNAPPSSLFGGFGFFGGGLRRLGVLGLSTRGCAAGVTWPTRRAVTGGWRRCRWEGSLAVAAGCP